MQGHGISLNLIPNWVAQHLTRIEIHRKPNQSMQLQPANQPASQLSQPTSEEAHQAANQPAGLPAFRMLAFPDGEEKQRIRLRSNHEVQKFPPTKIGFDQHCETNCHPIGKNNCDDDSENKDE